MPRINAESTKTELHYARRGTSSGGLSRYPLILKVLLAEVYGDVTLDHALETAPAKAKCTQIIDTQRGYSSRAFRTTLYGGG